MKLTYAKSGVDIRKADEFVAGIKGFVTTDALTRVNAFGSLFNLRKVLKKYRKPVLVSSTDGVGTKLKIAQELGAHSNVGVDLVGMNVNDVACLGAQPLFFLDYVACGKVQPKVLKEVVSGIYRGLQEAGCALLGGETAEMPGMYKPDEYDLAGFCVGVVDESKIIDGRDIRPGDAVIGLASSGPHSNGFSLIRKALGSAGVKKYARELLAPTRIYVKPALGLVAAVKVKGLAHVTGGAFYNKATKVLPKGLGMVVDAKSWPVPKIFKIIQASGNIEDKEMYTVLNMGIGMIAVVDKKDADRAPKILAANRVRSYRIGEIVKSPVRMRIV